MTQLSNRLSTVFISLGLAYGNAVAAEHSSEQDFFQELPVVLSASRLSQPITKHPMR